MMRDAGIEKRAREDCFSVWSLIVMITDGGMCNESSDNCTNQGVVISPRRPQPILYPFLFFPRIILIVMMTMLDSLFGRGGSTAGIGLGTTEVPCWRNPATGAALTIPPGSHRQTTKHPAHVHLHYIIPFLIPNSCGAFVPTAQLHPPRRRASQRSRSSPRARRRLRVFG